MDTNALRTMQAPLKERYQADRRAARITLRADRELGEDVSCIVYRILSRRIS